MSPASHALSALIRAYQFVLSPVLGGNCRFDPSCSAYALEAIRRFGAFRGGWLALRRVARCHPWCAAGHDPIPRSLGQAMPTGRLR